MRYLLFISILSTSLLLQAQQATNCNGDYFLSLGSPDLTGFYRINISPNEEVTFSPLPTSPGYFVNAVGFRSTDNFIYGLSGGNKLNRIDASGNSTILATLTDLETDELSYYAGDVSPDGLYLVVLGTGGDPKHTSQLARINLNDYSVQKLNLPDAEELNVSIGDFVFDTETGNIYAFDSYSSRLLKIDSNTGEMDFDFYPPSTVAKTMGAIFIDAFGDLYGYGKQFGFEVPNTFFEIEKITGEVTVGAIGPETLGKDACSCPYSVEMKKAVTPKVALPCDEVTYVFTIANGSAAPLIDLDFIDVLPEDLIITEIVYNPFNGNILSGVGTNTLSFEDVVLPQGVDSIVIRASVSEQAEGVYKNQATIKNLSEGLGEQVYSDDPSTVAIEDSTALLVPEFTANIKPLESGLCPGETLLLEAPYYPTATYLWSTGSTESSISINAIGWYTVEIFSNCDSVTDSMYVYPTNFTIDAGPDIEIELGDSISLPLIYTHNPDFIWTDDSGDSLSCPTCPRPFVRPFFDASYSVIATDEFGCILRDEINIKVKKDRKIYIPSAFSPNFDGINDIFYIQGKGFGYIRKFTIYNRWGAVVFGTTNTHINDIYAGWDGRFNGQVMGPALFVYLAEIEFLDGERQLFDGDVLLVR